MAKSSRVVVSSRAGQTHEKNRSLFTAAERQLLAASEASGLSRSTPVQLQAFLARARTLRDKWRDLLKTQSRVQKRATPAVTQANARSRAKGELFDGAVKRIEAHLASLATAAKGLLPAAKAPAARKTPIKKARVAGHRRSRAGLRAELTEQTRRLNERAALPARPAATKVAVVKTPAASAPVEPKPAAQASRAVKTKGGSRRRAGKKTVAAAAQAIRFDRAKQRSVKTAAKNAMLTVQGRTTRLTAHVVASGKRAQARRDRRGR